MRSFFVFVLFIRPNGSDEQWVRRFIAAEHRGQVLRAMKLENMEVREGPIRKVTSLRNGQREAFLKIREGMEEAWEQITIWVSAGFRYLLWTRGRIRPVRELYGDEEGIVYDLLRQDDRFLGIVRLAHHVSTIVTLLRRTG